MAKSSKKITVRFQSELVDYFQNFLAEDPDIHWIPARKSAASPRVIGIKMDGRTFQFLPLYHPNPNFSWIQIQKESLKKQPLLLVVPCLSARMLDYCKQNDISAIDLNGRAWLRAPGLLVDRQALPERSFRYELEPRNIFIGKSARIIRCLLTDHERLWTQAEIIPRTKASPALVSRIVQHLIGLDYAEKMDARTFRLRSPFDLLDAWEESKSFFERTFTKSYASSLFSNPSDLALHIQEMMKKKSIPIAFTQWIAAWLRCPFTEPPLVSAYVSRLPDTTTLQSFGLREVTEGGKLWLHVPDDEGIFLETQRHHDLTLTTDAQIYMDLQHTGLRGPDAAEALRNWEGFCKP